MRKPRTTSSARQAARHIARGTVGLAKAAVGLDKADGITMIKRWAICESCASSVKTAGIVQTCAQCHCMLRAKIRLARERCPLNKW